MSLWPSNSYKESGPPGSAPQETQSVASEKSLENPEITEKGDPGLKVSPTTLKLVTPRSKFPSRPATTHSQPCSSNTK